ncbi:MAG TPA: hypothetical protein VMM14_07265 [Acidimicrobiia bacterium]|nr:hypothetical protein [Acidimicrobiia bacterium]
MGEAHRRRVLAVFGQAYWLGWMLVLAASLGLASAVVTALEGQLTTLSEPLLFRPSSFHVTIWLLIASLELRRTNEPVTAFGAAK